MNWCQRTCNTVDKQWKILDVEFRSQIQLNYRQLGSDLSRDRQVVKLFQQTQEITVSV